MDQDKSWLDRWVPEKVKPVKRIMPTVYYEVNKLGKIKLRNTVPSNVANRKFYG